MKTRNRLTAVALAAACANGAFAMDVAGFEFNGYSRGGPVFNHSDGVKGNLALGGELQKFRLGNEGDNGIEVNFARTFEAGGVKWKVNYMPAKWGSGDISTEQAFVEMSGFSFAPEAKFWAGQRRLRIQDVHIVDYFLLNYGDNIGAGVTDVPVGGMKLGVGLFTGDKFDGNLPNNVKAHRINADLSEINTNPGGKLRVLLTAVGGKGQVNGGSGSGINLSNIRSSAEHLKGGGTASGPVSFMRGADSSAGTIKSGGKTRRAAKMVILNVDHPDIEEFIWCKAREERKARDLQAAGWDMSLDGKDITSVQYQNANNSVRITDLFLEREVPRHKNRWCIPCTQLRSNIVCQKSNK